MTDPELEVLAKKLEEIGDDNADWVSVAKAVAVMILEARIEELDNYGDVYELSNEVWNRINDLTQQKKELEDKCTN